MMRRLFLWALLVCGSVLVILVSLEGAIEFVLRFPRWVPSLYRPAPFVNHLKNYYLGFDRSIVQFRHDCAQYDERVIYRLRPGQCTVVNREHTVIYNVNRAGLRDSDAALDDPSIIVIGDSIAMGWGVAAEATLASRLGALTGAKVLNAGISSYETARETELLRELIKPATKYVVIVYCDNDYQDNWESIRTGLIPHRTRADYEHIVSEHERTVPYYPLKHVLTLTRLVWNEQFPAPQQPPPLIVRPGFAAMNFLAILDSHRELLRGRTVIALEVNSFNANSPAFATALREAAARSDLLKDVGAFHVIDASSFLTDDDYFLIDDHPSPRGQDKLAHAVAAIVQGDNRWRVAPKKSAPPAPAGGDPAGRIDTVEHKGAFTVIQGWAARAATGEPAARVALVRDGEILVEAEPTLRRNDMATRFKAEPARWSGFGLAVATDRLAGAAHLEVDATWKDGTTRSLGAPAE